MATCTPQLAQLGDGRGGGWPWRICNGDKADHFASPRHVHHGPAGTLQPLCVRSERTKVELLGVHQQSIAQEDSLPIDRGPHAHALDVLEAVLCGNGKTLCTPSDGLR
jgi:hypothetical protein